MFIGKFGILNYLENITISEQITMHYGIFKLY